MQFQTPAERMNITLTFALIVHAGVIFGVGYTPPETGKELRTTLDILLVDTVSPDAPEKAQYISQANREGGGDSDDNVRPTTTVQAPFPDVKPAQANDAVTPQQARPAQTAQTRPLTTRQDDARTFTAEYRELRDDQPDEGTGEANTADLAPLNAATMIMEARQAVASIQAELDERAQMHAKRPKHKFISASTREYHAAGYMEAWRRKVERIGKINFPDEARRRQLSGEVTLDVALRSNGTIYDIEVITPSRHRVIDDAAIRIARLAAPFAPFTDGIREEIGDSGILHIIRRWQFTSNGSVMNF